ncbi:MAG: hypothetical protein II595_06125, partial [Desulfovibrio sp.]|nr:hypothetical protein [Desulfovibrio sp.]
ASSSSRSVLEKAGLPASPCPAQSCGGERQAVHGDGRGTLFVGIGDWCRSAFGMPCRRAPVQTCPEMPETKRMGPGPRPAMPKPQMAGDPAR